MNGLIICFSVFIGCVWIQDSLYLYGGIVEERNVSSELWEFNVGRGAWRLVTGGHDDHSSAPFHAGGTHGPMSWGT